MRRGHYGDDFTDALASAATSAASGFMSSSVTGVRVDTTLLPPLQLVGSGAASGGGGLLPALDLGSILKPKITITLPFGNPIVYAPYGDPGTASWVPFLLFVAGSLLLAYRLGQRSQ